MTGELIIGSLIKPDIDCDRTAIMKYRAISLDFCAARGFWTLVHEIEPDSLSVCTGVKDGSGKLIWSGDAVKSLEFHDSTGKVYYVGGCFLVKWDNNDIEDDVLGAVNWRISVVKTS